MDNTVIIQQIRERFEKRIEKDTYLAKVQRKIEEGTATMVDADIYAGRLAECYDIAIGEVLGKSTIEEYKEMVDAVLPKGFHQITDQINDRTMKIIDHQLREAEIGMKAVPAEYDYRKERKVVGEIQRAAENAEEVSQVEPVASRQIESFAQNAAVNTIWKNAQAQSNAGIEALVTRRYDGIGVHSRKDPCEWCLERCGENMPYSEAYAKGAFERHPGCHCEIFYKPKKGGWQRQNDWKSNTWQDSQDPQKIEYRKSFMGIPLGRREDLRVIPKSVGARVFKNSIIDFETGMEYHIGGNGRVSNVEVFAGKGSKDKYHKAYKYSNKYGGLPDEWKHMKGNAYIENDYESGFAEIHWSEHDEYGSYDPFVKKWL